ncbi:hypothetical protein, conserved [Babesia bigemina]|uniref:C3H1-type domain-containing protein n=1 Tax=Babesia bigemina TaxID=5866 RepID=A0A061BT71_BABBI|nr:hypothetical protein, conserved [Babesia bigemina]CDR71709.1 hypothetical protein, conserved [Babesia bigemina]|eukprot:XP_012770655.1 hypothetical protein, conserved [Babesia bigemina]
MMKRQDVIERLSDVLSKGFFGFKEWNGIVSFTTLLAEIKSIIDGPNTANTLARIIEDANTFYSSVIHYEAETVIAHLQAFVAGRSAAALTAIQSRAKEDYYEATRKMFTAMQRDVHMQIDEINNLIALDYNNGVKGLLKRVMDKDNAFSGSNNKLKKLDVKKTDSIQANERLRSLSANLKAYLVNILSYVFYPVGTGLTDDPAKKVKNIQTDVDELLEHLSVSNDSKKYNYDNKFVTFLTSLSSSLTALHPSAFANPRHPELLDAVRAGLQGFVTEMGRVYVNGYEGGEGIDKLGKLVTNGGNTDGKLTDDGRNFSKIFLTILETLYHDFVTLQGGCKKDASGHKQQLCLYVDEKGKRNGNRLGSWLKERGFDVPSTKDKQDGELDSKKTGKNIHDDMICKKLENVASNTTLTTWKKKKNSETSGSTSNDDITLLDILGFFHDQLLDYFKTSHLRHIPSPKAPCNVYQMLQWLTGLRHNPMYDKLCGHFKGLFKKPEGDKANDVSEYKLESTESKLNAGELSTMLRKVCNISVDVLVAIQGHGHADGVYAIDFYVNSEGLSYPSNPGQCFDLLVDVASRVYHQMLFVYKQCNNGPQSSGWSDCHYGRSIAGSAWNCNTFQCPDQECKQKHDQTADQHYKCGIKSPLQSFLEDGLPGFLPHQFTKPGCKLECAVPNHFGKPCLTPMGFADIGIAASHTKQGKHLKDVLEKFCGSVEPRLTKLCSMLTCLLQKPPQTLGDILAFYHKFLDRWEKSGEHKRDAFVDAVRKANFRDEQTKLNVVCIQSGHRHTESHVRGELLSLMQCNSNKTPTPPCGAYLQPLYLEIRETYSKHHADRYLSWVVYITETFYDLLKRLYDECCKKCNTPGSRCYEKCCTENCQVTYSADKPSVKTLENANHNTSCNSIVKCPNTHPTLYKYGFTFGSPYDLSGQYSQQTRRTCKDFCTALERVLGKGCLLADLLNNIDNFLWAIRTPFSYLVLALWSLSLFYLICVMVGRLDVLHIRSHLRIPSSHRITAQSLLAAAQVGRLAKISYLQP